MEDITYCSSSFLMYRTIADHSKYFSSNYMPRFYTRPNKELDQIHDSFELEKSLRRYINEACAGHKAALALSGGIDSAILAKFMPEGSIAYTFKCIVPGVQVKDETGTAAEYAKACGLEHRVIEIYWEDFEKYAPYLMKHKGAPIHSIEVQIYKAALQAIADGHDMLIFGESADLNYGGLSGLHSREWTVGEFIDRYSYVKPYHALKKFRLITEPIEQYEKAGYVDVHEFCRDFFFIEAMGSYSNACAAAGINLLAPYSYTHMAILLNMDRIRSGENKYLVREVFQRLYPGFSAPLKLPMPRPMDEWFDQWEGPTRPEFWPHCTDNMSGDQKYYVWILEKFLNMITETN